MPKAIHHIVKLAGRKPGEADLEIPVAEDIASVPGTPVSETDISFYSRTDPLKNPDREKAADLDWAWGVMAEDVIEYRRGHNERMKPLLQAAYVTGDLEPTADAEPGKDRTEEIRSRAYELGFGEVGFTKFDHRYTYVTQKSWVKYEHAVCLAIEQDYEQTQSIPSLKGEYAHFGTYEVKGALVLKLIDYIRSLGYHAQAHIDGVDSGAYIPMFVDAGLGQLGANGQLLMPRFGSRGRLAIVTTDAPVTYGARVDYGMNKFCQECQVCVNRCPGRALVRDKIWWRGAQKNKVIYDRCRPVMSRFDGCGICMKVCPVQRYGMKQVLEHYVETGDVLGKGTDNLEGYTLRDTGYFGAGQLPKFTPEFYDIPNSKPEDWIFEQFKARLRETEDVPPVEEVVELAENLKKAMDKNKRPSWEHHAPPA